MERREFVGNIGEGVNTIGQKEGNRKRQRHHLLYLGTLLEPTGEKGGAYFLRKTQTLNEKTGGYPSGGKGAVSIFLQTGTGYRDWKRRERAQLNGGGGKKGGSVGQLSRAVVEYNNLRILLKGEGYLQGKKQKGLAFIFGEKRGGSLVRRSLTCEKQEGVSALATHGGKPFVQGSVVKKKLRTAISSSLL